MEKLKETLKGEDTDAIKAATEELTQLFYKMSEKLYQQQAPQGDPNMGGQQPGGDPNGGQQYYDADYEVVDDDKDKKYWERVLEAFTGITGEEKDFGEAVKNITLQGNVKGNITLVGRIPYAKDIISILQGYTVDRMDAGAVDDIVRATKSMISSANGQGKKTAAYNVKQFLTVVSKIFGVSVANLGRDTWAIARSIASETGNVRLMFEMEKAIYRMDKSAGNRKTWCELLYRAQKDRDTETARLIYREMLVDGTVKQRKEQRAIGATILWHHPAARRSAGLRKQDEPAAQGNPRHAEVHGTQEGYRMDPIF